jgi:hypothetical protein
MTLQDLASIMKIEEESFDEPYSRDYFTSLILHKKAKLFVMVEKTKDEHLTIDLIDNNNNNNNIGNEKSKESQFCNFWPFQMKQKEIPQQNISSEVNKKIMGYIMYCTKKRETTIMSIAVCKMEKKKVEMKKIKSN